MAENVKRINVTLPIEQVMRMKKLVAEHPSAYPSVSAFVSEAVSRKLADEDAHYELLRLLREGGGEPTEEDRAWAAEAWALARRVAGEADSGGATDAR